MATANTAVYLYCIVRAAARPAVARAPSGLPSAGHPEVHRVAPSLWIVAAPVPLDVYGPSHLEPRLRDLDWVSQAAVAHERVVEHFARSRRAAVIPMKLFTMFSTIETAVADVGARARAIQRAMRHIAGAEEWGIRVYRQAGSTAGPEPVPRAASGADFLRARKQVRDAAATARATAAEATDRAFDRLRRLARDVRVREARRDDGTNPPMLDAAFLVAAAARARFKAEARRQTAALAAAGADLALSGPWPAYNFVADGDRA